MSQFVEGEVAIKDQECLIEALIELGYAEEHIEVHTEAKPLYGYRGDQRKETAHVIVRRRYVGNTSNDVGFRRNKNGTFTAIVSKYDSKKQGDTWNGHLDQKHSFKAGGFVTGVKTLAALGAAEKTAKKRGFKTRRIKEGNRVRLACSR